MGRGQYTSIGGERGERGERGGHRWSGSRGGRSWGGRGWWGGGWPYSSYVLPSYSSYVLPSYSSYVVPNYVAPSYGYALPAYDITDSGDVYPTGQAYVPNYSYALPATYALPYYGVASAFPHWRSPRHFMQRHRRRLRHLIGQEVD